ncbi:MAG TPA: flagellar assembly protein FliW [Thermosulfurimonas dismutans]|uniref:Flagellar assembly factor FliW n=1 Tax=Thermosulfurimonas dismutans TaxID=999894 RepID=A0A7C3CKV9_9BACT|nr:flagellar assembly protein FliW [Thermosulfurimonas dismutans]
MKILTQKFGEIEVEEEKILIFVSEILGFPDSKRYVLLSTGKPLPFMWLQSVDEPRVVFLVSPPGVFFPDYQPEIPSFYLELLKIENPAELDLLVILAPGKGGGFTANLLGPILVNVPRRLALQAVLDPEKYAPDEPLPLKEKEKVPTAGDCLLYKHLISPETCR